MSITIKDIALKAGVSVATVSRVINGSGKVSDEKRRVIEQIIKEYNYYPNAAAKSLITQASDMIGLVMPERINPFFVQVYDGVTRKADEKNISVLFYKTDEVEERQWEVLKQLQAQRVKGLLVTPCIRQTSATREMLKQMEAANIPVVLVDRDTEGCDFDAVFIDNKEAIYKATEQMIQEGCRRIGVITNADPSRASMRKMEGFLECMQDYEVEVNPAWIAEGELKVESGYICCKRLMEASERPEALVVFSSSEMIGCVRYLNETGLRIGTDVCLIGFDDLGTFPQFGLRLFTIERPMREMGEKAFQLLWERITNGNKKLRSREIILPTKIKRSGW